MSRGRKGAGYAGFEIALLIEAELIDEQTTITTTVHKLQVHDEDLPELPHDFHVDLIATPGALSDATIPSVRQALIGVACAPIRLQLFRCSQGDFSPLAKCLLWLLRN